MYRLQNLFPGIPIVESPLFESLERELGLSLEERRIADALNRKGFAVLDFPDENLDNRIERIRNRLAPSFGIDFSSVESDKTTGERRVQDAWKFDEDVKAIAANETIIGLLTKLYGRKAFPFQTLNFPVGTQQDAHSDSVHFSSLPPRFMCGVWLAMEDISADAGPLFYYPGSHRWPIMTNELIGRRGAGSDLNSAQDPYGHAWAALCDANDAKPAVFLARKGQALIWCANLLHGGSIQKNSRLTRWSQVTHYYFDDCIYYTPAYSDESVGRLDLRSPQSVVDGSFHHSQYLGETVDFVGARVGARTNIRPPSVVNAIIRKIFKGSKNV